MSYTSIISNSTQLNSTFLNLINSLMAVSSQPLDKLETQKDEITSKQGVYDKLSDLMETFENSVKSLLSTEGTYDFDADYTCSISGKSEDETVVTAKASSSAIAADYDISVTTLAKAHKVSSDTVTYTSQDLGYEGSFYLGGDGNSIADLTTSSTAVSEAGLGMVDTDKSELGTGTYFVETRYSEDNGWQFRLVDQDGNAASIAKNGSEDSYTTGWQNITAGETYDTARGLTITFGSDTEQYVKASKDSGAAAIDYTSEGVLIDIEEDDSLVDIAYAINHADYAEGEGIIATITDNKLVLAREDTGVGNEVIASDVEGGILGILGILDEGGDFKTVMQEACDAEFSIDGVAMTRSSNKNLKNVINGVTLNLAADAEGKDCTLSVEYEDDGQTEKLKSFLSAYNELITYLTENLTTAEEGDGTYSRGALSGDSMFQTLRLNLLSIVTGNVNNGGEYDSLSDIGITMDDDLKLSISDGSEIEDALTGNIDEVTQLLDGVMTRLKNKISKFTGTSGYVSTSSNALDTDLENMNDKIETLNERLTSKETQLYNKYANLQAELEAYSSTSSLFTSIYG